jgi:PAS domain S-box-containing protein
MSHPMEDLSHSARFFELLSTSYARLVGTALIEPGRGATWLYVEAPFAVLAHNTDPDPRFIYANRTAQRCFEYSCDELVGLHSRLSAEEPDRAERQRQLDAVASKGFVSGYSGLRIARSGRRFWIRDGVLWQLTDERGVSHGQAAIFRSWQDADTAARGH